MVERGGRRKPPQVFETDQHKFSHNVANFNWRWIARITAPLAECALQLTLMDGDSLSDSDPLYDPITVALDHQISLTHRNTMRGTPPLGPNLMRVKFDSWGQDKKTEATEGEEKGEEGGAGGRR